MNLSTKAMQAGERIMVAAIKLVADGMSRESGRQL